MRVIIRVMPVIYIFLGIFSGCDRNTQIEFFDVKPTTKLISYLYVPGLTGTEVMMGRYCPKFTAVTGEKILWHSGGQVIGQPHSAVVFPEIDLHKPKHSFTINPITAFINSIRRDLSPLAQRYFQDSYGCTVEDNPQSSRSVVNYSLNLGQANIAQHGDVKALKKAYCKHVKKYPDTDIMLYGDSRGAATIFNFIAQYKATQVKAAVLEACFDTVEHSFKHFLYSDKDRQAEKRLHNILAFAMGSYSKKGPFPCDYAEIIDDEIPLLFITSLKDIIVAPQCTFRLYKRLKERGHKKVHIAILKNVAHSAYMISDPDDKKNYEAVVHAFYKQYNLPHNSIKAAQGKKMFERSQPTVQEITKLYTLPACSIC